MGKPKGTRSPYSTWLLAVIVVLIVALAAFALVFGLKGGVSCAADLPTDATVTLLPPVSASTTIAPTTTASPTTTIPVAPLDFDGATAMSHIKVLAQDIGPRKSGTQAEDDALIYAKTYLQDLGYQVDTVPVTLPGGKSSRDLYAIKQGRSNSVVVVGGHIDSKAGAPGGNDNASGVAVVLELARDLQAADTAATIEFVVFGAEEMTDSNSDHHHYGSRQFVEALTAAQQSALVGMVSVDMVGYGSEFTVRTMRRGPQSLSDMLKTYSNDHGLAARFSKDTGTYGWSDHEAFELTGYPAVWLEWNDDPTYHTARDTYAHCDPTVVQRTGDMLLGFLARLSESDLETLAAAREL
jgi:aminopeptidase YwaD